MTKFDSLSFVLGDEIMSNSLRKADLFAKQFSENYTLSPSDNFPIPSIPALPDTMSEISFKSRDLWINNKSPGLDGIPTIVPKKCSYALAPILQLHRRVVFYYRACPEHSLFVRKGTKALAPTIVLHPSIQLSENHVTIFNTKILDYLESNRLIYDRQ